MRVIVAGLLIALAAGAAQAQQSAPSSGKERTLGDEFQFNDEDIDFWGAFEKLQWSNAPALKERLMKAAGPDYDPAHGQFNLDVDQTADTGGRHPFKITEGVKYRVIALCEQCSNMALLVTDAFTPGAKPTEDGEVVGSVGLTATTRRSPLRRKPPEPTP